MSDVETSIVFNDAQHGTLAVQEDYATVKARWDMASQEGKPSFEVTQRNGRPISVGTHTIRTITPLVSDIEKDATYTQS